MVGRRALINDVGVFLVPDWLSFVTRFKKILGGSLLIAFLCSSLCLRSPVEGKPIESLEQELIVLTLQQSLFKQQLRGLSLELDDVMRHKDNLEIEKAQNQQNMMEYRLKLAKILYFYYIHPDFNYVYYMLKAEKFSQYDGGQRGSPAGS
jgi:hypothetical protein